MNATAGVRGSNANSTPRKHIASAVIEELKGSETPKTARELSEAIGYAIGEVKGVLIIMNRTGSVVKIPRTAPIQWTIPGKGPNIVVKTPSYTVRAECRTNVIRLLGQASKPMTVREIADTIGAESGMVSSILLQLRRDGTVRSMSDRPCLWILSASANPEQTDMEGWE